jgi:hypothetical protein
VRSVPARHGLSFERMSFLSGSGIGGARALAVEIEAVLARHGDRSEIVLKVANSGVDEVASCPDTLIGLLMRVSSLNALVWSGQSGYGEVRPPSAADGPEPRP